MILPKADSISSATPTDLEIVFAAPRLTAPRVSVIIMLRNEAPTLPITLQSLEMQQVSFPYEVIFIDGYSSDNSLAIIRDHPLARRVPITIARQPADNNGMVLAQNQGARMARGEILIFMQADVCIKDTAALAKVAAAFQDPAVVGTYFTGLGAEDYFAQYDFWGQIFMSRYQGTRIGHDFDTKFTGVRRATFENLGGFDDRQLSMGGNDFEFLTRLWPAGKIVESGVEVIHVHGFKKRYTAWGLIKKYCRNSEVAGVIAPLHLKHLGVTPALRVEYVYKFAICAACLFSLWPWFWPWSLLPVLALGLAWNRAAFVQIRNWRLIWVPFFSFVVMYCFTFYFLRGLLTRRTLYDFDNKMH